jgi:BA14K-like protein
MRCSLTGLTASLAVGAMLAIGSATPSLAQFRGHAGGGGHAGGFAGRHFGGVGHVGGFAGHRFAGSGQHGFGGAAAGLAAGAIVGGALANGYGYGYGYPAYPYDYGYNYGQDYALVDPGYAQTEPAYPAGGSVAYCEQTYRSYDPASGTYLGYDGLRHPCP